MVFWAPRLHRWPAGYSDPWPGAAIHHGFALCGDFVANPRFGSIERAALSGLAAADAIAALGEAPMERSDMTSDGGGSARGV